MPTVARFRPQHSLSHTAWRTARLYSQARAQPQPPHPQNDNSAPEHGGEPRHTDHRASAKLFQDAAGEDALIAERAARMSRLEASLTKHENWTGDEPVEHAVLRMLVDKYKPLRSGALRTADEKLRKAPPQVQVDVQDSGLEEQSREEGASAEVRTSWGASARALADVPLLPSIEGHQPWHTTFKVPSHAQSSVKYGNIPPAPRASSGAREPVLSALDDKARRKEREARRRSEKGVRLHNARESTLDYRLGVKGMKRPNPVSLKGWAGLVEERIERARQEGRFDRIKGRGQPLKPVSEEHNPFIAREEFLLNRIVQRQGAVPPWVEIQQELESAVNSFRDVLRQSWTRRAIRMLTVSRPPSLLPRLTVDDLTAWRDTEWEARERAYHETALEEINALVRKYNGLAPYAVRRAYYVLGVELERTYKDSGEDILAGIAERVRAQSRPLGVMGVLEEDESLAGRGGDGVPVLRLRDLVRQWIARLAGR